MLFGAANGIFYAKETKGNNQEKNSFSLLFLPVCTNFAPTTVYKQ